MNQFDPIPSEVNKFISGFQSSVHSSWFQNFSNVSVN